MAVDQPAINDQFDRRIEFPDPDAHRRFSRLVGLELVKSRLVKQLSILVNPDGPQAWAQRHHPGARVLLDYVERRPPLVILAGDVGTGKTEVSETVGDAVARLEKIGVTLYPLSLATRGSGRVGEMTQLVSAAFDQTVAAAQRFKRAGGRATGGVILLVDEADALTQTREDGQMHHEDKAGVNAFIRGVDRLAEQRLPAAVILCTNRLSAIDPAVQRRAAEIFEFQRPNDAQRRSVLETALGDAGFSAADIGQLVQRTGPTRERPYGFTYSDLTQRLLPTLVLDAYPDGPVTATRALQLVETLHPTPPFRDRRA